jgi:hypothetical protein
MCDPKTKERTVTNEKNGPDANPYTAENAMRFGCAVEVYHSARMRMPERSVEKDITLNLF